MCSRCSITWKAIRDVRSSSCSSPRRRRDRRGPHARLGRLFRGVAHGVREHVHRILLFSGVVRTTPRHRCGRRHHHRCVASREPGDRRHAARRARLRTPSYSETIVGNTLRIRSDCPVLRRLPLLLSATRSTFRRRRRCSSTPAAVACTCTTSRRPRHQFERRQRRGGRGLGHPEARLEWWWRDGPPACRQQGRRRRLELVAVCSSASSRRPTTWTSRVPAGVPSSRSPRRNVVLPGQTSARVVAAVRSASRRIRSRRTSSRSTRAAARPACGIPPADVAFGRTSPGIHCATPDDHRRVGAILSQIEFPRSRSSACSAVSPCFATVDADSSCIAWMVIFFGLGAASGVRRIEFPH